MSWRVASDFGRIARKRFGRSNERTKICGWRTNNFAAISARVGASAVAVTPIVWTPPSASATSRSRKYSGRKSWPHCETQCASSIARRSIETSLKAARTSSRKSLPAQYREGCSERSRRPRATLPTLVDVGGGIEARRLDAKLAQLRRPDRASARSAARRPGSGRSRTIAGSWKQSDLPLPVGITASTSLPSSVAARTSSWPGAKGGKAKDARERRARLRHQRRLLRHRLPRPGRTPASIARPRRRSAPVASMMRRSKPSAAPLASGMSASALRKSSSIGWEVP